MAHEDISLTEWNDAADTLRDLADGVRRYGQFPVMDALTAIAMCSLPDAEAQND